MSDTSDTTAPAWLVPFDAPQAPNVSVLRTEAAPTGQTVSPIDTEFGIAAPQAPGPDIDLSAP